MHQDIGTAAATENYLRADDASGMPGVSQTCSRRYSEVMREYLRRHHRGSDMDEHNIKLSEVVTRQADHAGPNGTSYVSWDNPETPGMFAPCLQPIPVVEDHCVVHDVQEVHSPLLSLYSPVTPESGAESYTTAKTHLSSHIPTQSPTPRSNSRLAQGYLSPNGNSSQRVPVGADSIQSERCKVPIKNIYSAGGSPKFYTFQHTSQDEEDDSDFDLEPSLPMHLLQSGRVDSSGSFTNVPPNTNETPFGLPSPALTSPNRTYVIDPKNTGTFGIKSVMNDETAASDVSTMRDEECQAAENHLNPIRLDFERDSCLDSDASLYPEEHIGELSYPPDEVETSSYNLKSKSPQSWGSIGFSWLNSTRNEGGQDIPEQIKKIKRMIVFGWVLVGAGSLLLLAAVCVYFALA